VFVETAPPLAARSPVTAARATWPRRLARAAVPYAYVAPALAMVVIWTYRPLVGTAQLSLYSWNLLPTAPATPVGLDNYRRLLELPDLGHAVGRTFLVIVGLLPFTLLVPVVVGLLTRRVRGRARTVYQAMIFAPFLVAPVAAASVWLWLLDLHQGVVNRALGLSVNWFNDPHLALWAVILMTGWSLLGFAVLVVAAGLAGINPDYAQAAALDGARRGQITRWVTLPLLSPTLVFLLLMTVLLSGQLTFPLINTVTQGGPLNATTTIYYLLWDYGFRDFNAGLASAAGILFFLGFTVLAAGLVWLSEKVTFHDN